MIVSPAFAPPSADLLAPSGSGPQLPVPFEDLQNHPGFWDRVGGMFRLVFSNPMELFERVPVTQGFSAPWRFLLLLSIPAFLFSALIFSLLGMGAMVAAIEQSGKGDAKAIAAMMPVIFGIILLLMPLFSFLGMLLGGALNHFFLWIWGGLRPGFGTHQSIRAFGYVTAFIQLGGAIPILGALIQLAGLVILGMGLARMHRTDTWRGICAVITPIVLVICALFLILIAVLVAAAR